MDLFGVAHGGSFERRDSDNDGIVLDDVTNTKSIRPGRAKSEVGKLLITAIGGREVIMAHTLPPRQRIDSRNAVIDPMLASVIGELEHAPQMAINAVADLTLLRPCNVSFKCSSCGLLLLLGSRRRTAG